MKKLLLVITLLSAMFISGLNADESNYDDWVWIGTSWVYTGTDSPIPSPPPIRF